MTRRLNLKKVNPAYVFVPICLFIALPAIADGSCSTKSVSGKWVFATGIGRQMLGEPFPPNKDITAIGTMNIAKDGSLSGVFDATVQDTFFLPGIPYSGSVVVNADCTGTLTFVTGAGTMRTDSIVVVSKKEMLGMSQDPLNLWTYQVRRISGNKDNDD